MSGNQHEKVQRQKINWRKVVIELATLSLASLASYFAQPWYHANDNDVASVLVSIFSILAGFLLAVMAVIANDRVLRGSTWRQDTYYLRLFKAELFAHQLTFCIYLLVLVLALMTMLDKSWACWVQRTGEHLLMFFTTWGLILSFRLPWVLGRKYRESLEHRIRERRKAETDQTKQPPLQ